jgi:hypothetical protein
MQPMLHQHLVQHPAATRRHGQARDPKVVRGARLRIGPSPNRHHLASERQRAALDAKRRGQPLRRQLPEIRRHKHFPICIDERDIVPDHEVPAALQRGTRGGNFARQPDIVLVGEQDDIGIGPPRRRNKIAGIPKPIRIAMNADRKRCDRGKRLEQRHRRIGGAIVGHNKAVRPARLPRQAGQLGGDKTFPLPRRHDDCDN